MLSRAADAFPAGEGWQFEPKWDGFRTLVFRDGDEILLQSRDEKTMNRYFPELIAPLAATLSERCVIDGEIVIVGGGGLDFEALLLRIHPAASRVKLLSAQAAARSGSFSVGKKQRNPLFRNGAFLPSWEKTAMKSTRGA